MAEVVELIHLANLLVARNRCPAAAGFGAGGTNQKPERPLGGVGEKAPPHISCFETTLLNGGIPPI